MSTDDVKPDINALDDSQPSQASQDQKPKLQIEVHHEGRTIKFNMKHTHKLDKVLKGAATALNMDIASLKFIYNNQRVRADDTPTSLDMEDGDVIDAYLQQIGGGIHH